MSDYLTPAEALMTFLCRHTCSATPLILGAAHDAGPAIMAYKQFCEDYCREPIDSATWPKPIPSPLQRLALQAE